MVLFRGHLGGHVKVILDYLGGHIKHLPWSFFISSFLPALTKLLTWEDSVPYQPIQSLRRAVCSESQ